METFFNTSFFRQKFILIKDVSGHGGGKTFIVHDKKDGSPHIAKFLKRNQRNLAEIELQRTLSTSEDAFVREHVATVEMTGLTNSLNPFAKKKVSTLDFFFNPVDDVVFMVTSYIDGTSARVWIESDFASSLDRCDRESSVKLFLFQLITFISKFTRLYGKYHNDLHMENVRVSNTDVFTVSGECSPKIYIIDFGFAQNKSVNDSGLDMMIMMGSTIYDKVNIMLYLSKLPNISDLRVYNAYKKILMKKLGVSAKVCMDIETCLRETQQLRKNLEI